MASIGFSPAVSFASDGTGALISDSALGSSPPSSAISGSGRSNPCARRPEPDSNLSVGGKKTPESDGVKPAFGVDDTLTSSAGGATTYTGGQCVADG
jgi:hypothetical protein